MVHTVGWRVGSEEALDFWADRLAAEDVPTHREERTLWLQDPEELAHKASGSSRPTTSRSSRATPTFRGTGPAGLRRGFARSRRSRRRAAPCSRDALAFEPAREGEWEARGAHRGGLYARTTRRRPTAGSGGAGTVHHVAWASPPRRARGVAGAGAGGGSCADARDRPLLLQVDLLPRARRRPLRDRHDRAGVRSRRGSGAPRRAALAAAGVRAPPRADQARADADPRRSARAVGGAVTSRTRLAAGDPEGLLVLFHGRGADENDLFRLLDMLDPERRLLGVTPRGPLTLPPGGAHWYVVPRSASPIRRRSCRRSRQPRPGSTASASRPSERCWAGSRKERDGVLAGSREGPAGPATIVALSGFIPTVEGFELDLEAPLPPVAIGHGAYDPIIEVGFGRRRRSCSKPRARVAIPASRRFRTRSILAFWRSFRRGSSGLWRGRRAPRRRSRATAASTMPPARAWRR